jgi:prepilin-type processing-associated H-X9-DG protein
MVRDNAGYVVCAFDLRRDDMRLYLGDGDGKPFRGFSALADSLKSRGRMLRFAMNAGMFEEDRSPVGLFIEDGKRAQRADLREGATNFHLRPNGVFWIGDKTAGVVETARYLANPPPARFATQSGPMLVIDGRIHPKIKPTGESEKVRNGVCVRDGWNVIFAISNEPVTFHAFALLFKDGLGCANALFLDGSVSSLYAPELKRDDELVPLGPMVGVTTGP